MKKCATCQELKENKEFGKLTKSKDGLSYSCKDCSKKYRNLHYKNSSQLKLNIRRRAKDTRLSNRQFIYDYLKDKKCVDCGNNNPVVLQFDHRDQNLKCYSIANMRNFSLSKILTEIEKCDIRCANCHIIRTANQFDWYATIEK